MKTNHATTPATFVTIALAATLAAACGPVPFERLGDGRVSSPCDDTVSSSPDAFSDATPDGTKWLYQLQGASAEEIAATDFDIVVMDYATDGTEENRYGSETLDAIKDHGTRQVFAYLSIGEAEDYRYYFDPAWVLAGNGEPASDAPCWLGNTNPEWEGNYKVQYWSDAWQETILAYLDKIIDDGFDGVYLDIIDGFEYWADEENGEGFSIGEEEAAARMIHFVKRIAHHARTVRGESDFLIFPQNGEPILEYATGIGDLEADDYLNTISGIGIEDLYYDETTPIDASVTAFRKQYLDRVKDAGKKVVVVDYVDDGSHPDLVQEFRGRAIEDGYFPYAALSDRALDEINTFEGQP